MNSMLPCPFCGKEDITIHPAEYINECGFWSVTCECDHCNLTFSAIGDSKEEASEQLRVLWNTRKFDTGSDPRTCEIQAFGDNAYCSVCNKKIPFDSYFCSSCGSHVMKRWRDGKVVD